jgi:hypothetical protein
VRFWFLGGYLERRDEIYAIIIIVLAETALSIVGQAEMGRWVDKWAVDPCSMKPTCYQVASTSGSDPTEQGFCNRFCSSDPFEYPSSSYCREPERFG